MRYVTIKATEIKSNLLKHENRMATCNARHNKLKSEWGAHIGIIGETEYSDDVKEQYNITARL